MMKYVAPLAMAALASANVFDETTIGDAGNLPGLTQTECGDSGFGLLTSIVGTLAQDDDADMYEIFIASSSTFQMSTTSNGDPMLSLYTPDSTGVVIDDDGGGGLESLVSIGAPSVDKYYIALHRYVSQSSGPYGPTGDCLFSGCVSGSASSTAVLVGIPIPSDASSDLTYSIDVGLGDVTCTFGLVPPPVGDFTVENDWDAVMMRWSDSTMDNSYLLKFGTWQFDVIGSEWFDYQDETTGRYHFAMSLSSASYFFSESSSYFFQFQVYGTSTEYSLVSAKSTMSLTYFTTSWCNNGVLDGDETFADCGGSCGPCPPTCVDGIKNQDEILIDCGGSVCEACPESCEDGILNQDEERADCGGVCPECLPTCDDGEMNQDETDVDCGGSICPVCPPSCVDGIQNGSETDVDCGGKLCPACPTCSDGIQNQGEDDVDCGGPCDVCETCEDGIMNQDEERVDCGGVCEVCPTCDDGMMNWGEVDVDCGGPNCPACLTCDDNLMNQGEEGVDCGGPCEACPTCCDGMTNQGEIDSDCGGPCGFCNDALCETDADCASGFCECITTTTQGRRRLNMMPPTVDVTICMCAGPTCWEDMMANPVDEEEVPPPVDEEVPPPARK